MNRGIYITANDRATEQSIALLKSIRVYDAETPVVLIPYDEHYHHVADVLAHQFGVTVYEDLEFIDRLSRQLYDIFGEGFFARPNQFRKQACWFGPFEEFIYIDTDIVVFEKIIDNLNYLTEYDFICADYQHAGGIANVFTPKVLEAGVLTEQECGDIFNGGFWGSKQHRISESDLYSIFQECAAHPDYFDFSQKTSDQPIMNYMVLKQIPKRFNIVRRPGKAPGNWAGSPHFQIQGDRLFDPKVNQPLQYLHWAGMRIQPGCPYWEIWEHYRYLGEEKPPIGAQPTGLTPVWRKTLDQIKSKIKAY
jgi:hypothetical protein